jgi:hypothetical protein
MSDRPCNECAHLKEDDTCDFPTPFWVTRTFQRLDRHTPHVCDTFSERMLVVHLTPKIDETCQHIWTSDPTDQIADDSHCAQCGLSFQRYIHSCCP